MTEGSAETPKLSRRRLLQAAGATAAAAPVLALPREAEAVVVPPATPELAVPPEPKEPDPLAELAAYEAAYRDAVFQVWSAGVTLHALIADTLSDHKTLQAEDAIWLYMMAKDRGAPGRYPLGAGEGMRRRLTTGGYATFTWRDFKTEIALTDKGRAVVAAIDDKLTRNARLMRFFGPKLPALTAMEAPLLGLKDNWRDIVLYQL